MNHESMRLVTGDDLPKLLRDPFSGWMRRNGPVQDSSCTDFQDVTTTKKSHAITACAWFRIKVVHACASCRRAAASTACTV